MSDSSRVRNIILEKVKTSNTQGGDSVPLLVNTKEQSTENAFQVGTLVVHLILYSVKPGAVISTSF